MLKDNIEMFDRIEKIDKEITRLRENQVYQTLGYVIDLTNKPNSSDTINELLESLKEEQRFYLLAPIVRWLGTEYDADYYKDWYETYCYSDE